MAEPKESNVPVRQSVHVDCPIEDAFRLFTQELDQWWPLTSHSIGEDESDTCAIQPWTGGRIYERTRSGQEHDWGTVLVWDPPTRVEFTWHPGRRGDPGQTVDVEFHAEADGTRVTLIHTGWQFAGIRAPIASCFAEFAACQMVTA